MANTSQSSDKEGIIEPITEIITDAIEVLFDSNLDDSLLKDIPVYGSLLKLYKTTTSIRDKIFFKKITRFLKDIETIPDEESETFWKGFADEESKQILGEQLVTYIDRYDNSEKAGLLARAFGAFLKREINHSEFLDLSILIDSIKIHQLDEMAVVLLARPVWGKMHLGARQTDLAHLMLGQGLFLLESMVELPRDIDERKRELETSTSYKRTKLAALFMKYIIPEILNRKSLDGPDLWKYELETLLDKYNYR